jgi:hypothetical protein
MEVSVNNAAPFLRRRAVLPAVALLLAAALTAFLLVQRPQVASAELNDNQTACTGQVKPGEPDPDDPDVSVVHYRFKCSNPITGYQIVPGTEIEGFETEVFATDLASGDVVPEDSFSCNGDLPGLGLNCVGNYTGHWHLAEGTFKIDGNLCAHPESARIKPLLTVMRASIDSKGKPAQAIAGPFRLNGPKGCPKPPKKAKKSARKSAKKVAAKR